MAAEGSSDRKETERHIREIDEKRRIITNIIQAGSWGRASKLPPVPGYRAGGGGRLSEGGVSYLEAVQ